MKASVLFMGLIGFLFFASCSNKNDPKEFKFIDNGILRMRVELDENGEFHGYLSEYDSIGNLQTKVLYRNGKQTRQQTIYKNGVPQYQSFINEMDSIIERRWFYGTGVIKERVIIFSKRAALKIIYYENSNIKSVIEMVRTFEGWGENQIQMFFENGESNLAESSHFLNYKYDSIQDGSQTKISLHITLDNQKLPSNFLSYHYINEDYSFVHPIEHVPLFSFDYGLVVNKTIEKDDSILLGGIVDNVDTLSSISHRTYFPLFYDIPDSLNLPELEWRKSIN